jgi:hypothetical protein
MSETRILFIGNSYIAENDLTEILEYLAASRGNQVSARLIFNEKTTLEEHYWYDLETIQALRQESWDVVVMQEQSVRSIEEPEKMFRAATRLHQEIKNASTVLFLPWARAYLPDTQTAINNAYLELATQLHAKVAPVGIAWQNALKRDPHLRLYQEDGRHPTFLGSYLAACVMYATILGESPHGLPHELREDWGIALVFDQEKAELLQTIAWETVQEFSQEIVKNIPV